MTGIDERRCRVLLAVQQALLGEVTANLRAVTVEHGDTWLRLQAFFDREPDEGDVEAMSLVETQLLAHFPESHDVTVEIATLREPALIPKDRTWAYHRREPLVE
jgi:hypothetical protein